MISIIDSFKVTPPEYDVVLYVGVNGYENDEMKSWLESLKDDNVFIYFSDKNVGKAAIVNTLNNDIARKDHDYVMSIDSDMIVEDNMKSVWIDRMIQTLNMGFGLISSDQSDRTCHNYEMLKQVGGPPHLTLLVQKEGAQAWGIAGGCLILRHDTFRFIHGYQVHDVYNADDALIMRKVLYITGKNIAVLKDVVLRHPKEKDDAYQSWKFDKASGKIPNGPGTKGFYDR